MRKNNNYYRILIIVSIILIIVFIFYFNNLFFMKQENISDIISELPRKYQTDIEVSSNIGLIKGNMTRDNNKVIFEIKEPISLSGFQIIYDNEIITMKYKGLESNIKDNLIMKNFPIDIIINIENMIYKEDYDNWNIEDDLLYLEGQYQDDKFMLKIDLRQNKIMSYLLNNKNIGANVCLN